MEQIIPISDLLREVGSYKDVVTHYGRPSITLGELTFAFADSPTATLTLTNTGEGLLVRGTLLGTSSTSCSRCLNPAEVMIKIDIEEEVLSIESVESQEGEALPEQYTHDGHSIDLDPIIEQALVIELPTAPLCQSDCQGLCPICGVDRNLEQCDCQHERTDPRWDALNSLKQGISE